MNRNIPVVRYTTKIDEIESQFNSLNSTCQHVPFEQIDDVIKSSSLFNNIERRISDGYRLFRTPSTVFQVPIFGKNVHSLMFKHGDETGIDQFTFDSGIIIIKEQNNLGEFKYNSNPKEDDVKSGLFLVKSSSSSETRYYHVEFIDDDSGITVSCNCQDFLTRRGVRFCKHVSAAKFWKLNVPLCSETLLADSNMTEAGDVGGDNNSEPHYSSYEDIVFSPINEERNNNDQDVVPKPDSGSVTEDIPEDELKYLLDCVQGKLQVKPNLEPEPLPKAVENRFEITDEDILIFGQLNY